MDVVGWALIIVGAYAAFMYLLAPLIVGASMRQAAFPSFDAITPDQMRELSAPTRDFFQHSADAVTALGFTLAACGRQLKQMSNVSVYIMLFRKDPEQDWAMLAYMLVETKAVKQEISYVEFSTSYVDESAIATSNSSQLPAWESGPRRRQFFLPNVRDIARQYQIHRELIRRHATGASPKQVRDTQALTMLAEAIQREFREQEAKSWFYLDPAAIEYRPTTKGAYLMTWRQLWPVSAIRALKRDLGARRLDASVPR